MPSLTEDAIQSIRQLEVLAAEVEKKKNELRARLLEEMEKGGIVKLDVPELTVSYIAAGDKLTFDSKRLNEEAPDIYDAYLRKTSYKASLRIKIKNADTGA